MADSDKIKLTIEVDDQGSAIIKGFRKAILDLEDQAKKSTKKTSKLIKGLWADMAIGRLVAENVKKAFDALFTSLLAFEKNFAKINSILPESETYVSNFREELLALAGDLGSVEELTNGAYQALSQGVEPGNVIKFLADTAAFAKGNFVELEDSINIVSGVMNTYGIEAGNAKEITDYLTTAIQAGHQNSTEFSKSIESLIGPAQRAGISFKDLNALIMAMHSVGVQSSDAMSALQTVISNISAPSEEVKNAAEGMAGGFSVASLQSQELSEFLKNLVTHVGDNTVKQKALFGSVEAFNNIALLTSKGGLQELINAQNELTQSSGATSEALDNQNQSFYAQLDAIKNQIEGIYTSALFPVLQDLAKFLKENREEIIEFVKVGAEGLARLLKLFISLKDVLIPLGKVLIVYFAGKRISSFFKALGTGIGTLKDFGRTFIGLKRYGLNTIDSFAGSIQTTTNLTMNLTKSMGSLKNVLGSIGPIAASFFAGWQIGNLIRELTPIDDWIQAGLSKLQGSLEDYQKEANEHLTEASNRRQKDREAIKALGRELGVTSNNLRDHVKVIGKYKEELNELSPRQRKIVLGYIEHNRKVDEHKKKLKELQESVEKNARGYIELGRTIGTVINGVIVQGISKLQSFGGIFKVVGEGISNFTNFFGNEFEKVFRRKEYTLDEQDAKLKVLNDKYKELKSTIANFTSEELAEEIKSLMDSGKLTEAHGNSLKSLKSAYDDISSQVGILSKEKLTDLNTKVAAANLFFQTNKSILSENIVESENFQGVIQDLINDFGGFSKAPSQLQALAKKFKEIFENLKSEKIAETNAKYLELKSTIGNFTSSELNALVGKLVDQGKLTKDQADDIKGLKGAYNSFASEVGILTKDKIAELNIKVAAATQLYGENKAELLDNKEKTESFQKGVQNLIDSFDDISKVPPAFLALNKELKEALKNIKAKEVAESNKNYLELKSTIGQYTSTELKALIEGLKAQGKLSKEHADELLNVNGAYETLASKIGILTEEKLKKLNPQVQAAVKLFNDKYKSLNKSTDESKKLQKEVSSLMKEFKDLSNVPPELKEIYEKLKDVNGELEPKKVEEFFKEFAEKANVAINALENMKVISGDVATALKEVTGGISSVGGGIESIKSGFKGLNSEKKGMSGVFDKVLGGVSALGGALSAVSGAISIVKGVLKVFSGPSGELKAVRRRMKGMQMTTAGWGKKLEALAKQIGGAAGAGRAFNKMLADMINDSEITKNNFTTYVNKIREVICTFEEGSASAEETAANYGAAFAAIIPQAEKLGKTSSKAFIGMIKQAKQVREQGVIIKEVFDYVQEKLTGGNEAFGKYIDSFASVGDLQNEINDLTISLAKGNITVAESIELQGQLEEKQALLAETTNDLGSNWDFIQASGLSMFNSLQEGGKSFLETIDIMGPNLEKIATMAQENGIQVAEGLQDLIDVSAFMKDHEQLTTRVEATTAMLKALGESDSLKGKDFEMFSSQVLQQYDDVLEKTEDQNLALQMMAPSLDEIIKNAKLYNYTIDETTQGLIDQAQEAGVLTQHHKSASEIMREGFERLGGSIDRLCDTFEGRLPRAIGTTGKYANQTFGNAAQQTEDWNKSLDDVNTNLGDIETQVQNVSDTHNDAMYGHSIIPELNDWKNGLDNLSTTMSNDMTTSIQDMGGEFTTNFTNAEDSITSVDNMFTTFTGNSTGNLAEIVRKIEDTSTSTSTMGSKMTLLDKITKKSTGNMDKGLADLLKLMAENASKASIFGSNMQGSGSIFEKVIGKLKEQFPELAKKLEEAASGTTDIGSGMTLLEKLSKKSLQSTDDDMVTLLKSIAGTTSNTDDLGTTMTDTGGIFGTVIDDIKEKFPELAKKLEDTSLSTSDIGKAIESVENISDDAKADMMEDIQCLINDMQQWQENTENSGTAIGNLEKVFNTSVTNMDGDMGVLMGSIEDTVDTIGTMEDAIQSVDEEFEESIHGNTMTASLAVLRDHLDETIEKTLDLGDAIRPVHSAWVNSAADMEAYIGGVNDRIEEINKALESYKGKLTDVEEQEKAQYETELAMLEGILEQRDAVLGISEELSSTVFDFDNFDQGMSQIDSVFNALNGGLITTKEAMDEIGSSFNEMIDNAKDLGIEGSRSILNLINTTKNMGLDVPEISKYINEQLTDGVDALGEYLGTFNQSGEIKETIAQLEEELKDAKGADHQRILDELNKQYYQLDNSVTNVKKNFGSMGTYTLGMFNSLIAEGATFMEAMQAMGPQLSELANIAKDNGIEVDGALSEMLSMQRFIDENEELITRIDSTTKMMESLGNTGYLTADIFNQFQSDAQSQFDDLVAKSGNAKQAYQLMGPELSKLLWYSKQYNYELDENTKNLIENAQQHGVNMGAMIPPQEKMVSLMEELVTVLGGDIPYALEEMSDSATTNLEMFEAETNNLKSTIGDLGGDMNKEVGERAKWMQEQYETSMAEMTVKTGEMGGSLETLGGNIENLPQIQIDANITNLTENVNVEFDSIINSASVAGDAVETFARTGIEYLDIMNGSISEICHGFDEMTVCTENASNAIVEFSNISVSELQKVDTQLTSLVSNFTNLSQLGIISLNQGANLTKPDVAAATGFIGWVKKPTSFLIGEGGEDEFVSVIPKSKMGNTSNLSSLAGSDMPQVSPFYTPVGSASQSGAQKKEINLNVSMPSVNINIENKGDSMNPGDLESQMETLIRDNFRGFADKLANAIQRRL